VIQHAYGAEGGPLTVNASIQDDDLTISVLDEGHWKPRRDDRGGGRGVALMRAVMDEVDVVGAPSGTEVRMRRILAREHARG
jgi:anti-sigma regulatory factor (Ser/Thr protein kinase)